MTLEGLSREDYGLVGSESIHTCVVCGESADVKIRTYWFCDEHKGEAQYYP